MSSRTSAKGKAFSVHFAHVSTLIPFSVSLLCLIFASRGWQLLNPFKIKGRLFTYLFSKDQTENCIKERKNKENLNVMVLSRYLLLHKWCLLLTYGSSSSYLLALTFDSTTETERRHASYCSSLHLTVVQSGNSSFSVLQIWSLLMKLSF